MHYHTLVSGGWAFSIDLKGKGEKEEFEGRGNGEEGLKVSRGSRLETQMWRAERECVKNGGGGVSQGPEV